MPRILPCCIRNQRHLLEVSSAPSCTHCVQDCRSYLFLEQSTNKICLNNSAEYMSNCTLILVELVVCSPIIFIRRRITWHWAGTVWKAKNSSSGGAPVENPVARAGSDAQHVDNRPGRSFRNFRFDTASILQSMEASFLRS